MTKCNITFVPFKLKFLGALLIFSKRRFLLDLINKFISDRFLCRWVPWGNILFLILKFGSRYFSCLKVIGKNLFELVQTVTFILLNKSFNHSDFRFYFLEINRLTLANLSMLRLRFWSFAPSFNKASDWTNRSLDKITSVPILLFIMNNLIKFFGIWKFTFSYHLLVELLILCWARVIVL